MSLRIDSNTAVATVGTQFTYQIAASGQPTEYGATDLPTGLTLNPATGLISGIPQESITATVKLFATNPDGHATGNLTLVVLAVPVAKLDLSRRGQFAPSDYTDGRAINANGVLDWKTRYEPEAREIMFWEARYLLTVFFGSVLILAGILVFLCNCSEPFQESMPVAVKHDFFCAILIAWFSGVIGGCLFGMKWLYHTIAKGLWTEDRHYWRILTPHMSGATATFIVIIAIGTGITEFLKNEMAHSLTGVATLAFLSGYFSDKALAKLSEIADHIFGTKPRQP